MSSSQPPRKLTKEISIEEALAAKRKGRVQATAIKPVSKRPTQKKDPVSKQHDALVEALDAYESSPPALLGDLGEKTSELIDGMQEHLILLAEVAEFVQQAEGESEQIKEEAWHQAQIEAEEIIAKAVLEAEKSREEMRNHSAQLLSDLHEMVEDILAHADDPREAARNLKLIADKLKQRTDNL